MILDTNIIIDHLRTPTPRASLLQKLAKKLPREELALSVISVQELYEDQSTRSSQKEQALLATITPLKILSYTYEIAEMAGIIARDLIKPIELADAAIAATAIVNNAQLLTLNKKDFFPIKNLILYNFN